MFTLARVREVGEAEGGGDWQLPLISSLSSFHDRPSKEICQPFQNLNEHAHNAQLT